MDHNYFYFYIKFRPFEKNQEWRIWFCIQSPFISEVSAKELFLIMYNIIKFITLSGHEHVKTLKMQICNEWATRYKKFL